MKPEPSRATQGISFEVPILRAAKERAASKRMSLSAYVNQLIFEDLHGQQSHQAGLSAGEIADHLDKRVQVTEPSTDSS